MIVILLIQTSSTIEIQDTQYSTQQLYDYNTIVYSLSGIGILFIIFRSIRIISNILLTQMFPLQIILLGKYSLNLYYYCGLMLFTYMRFGTVGTQIPYDSIDSTNGLYYYLFGSNSNVQVQSPYLKNGNYTSVLPHDCDFTLIWFLILTVLWIPCKFIINWPKQFQGLLLLFIEGSTFELVLISTGQIFQTIKNSSTDALNIIFSCIGGVLILFLFIFTLRRSIFYFYPQNQYFNDYVQQQINIQDRNYHLYYLLSGQLQFLNQFISALIIPLINTQYNVIIYLQLGFYTIDLILCVKLTISNKQYQYINGVYGFIDLLYLLSYSLILVLNTNINNYQYGFILIIILSFTLSVNILLNIFQIYQYNQQNKNSNNDANALNTTNIELQQVILEQNEKSQNNSKVLDNSVISNIINKPFLSQFASQERSIQFNSNDGTVNFYIPKMKSFQLSEIFDSGFIRIQQNELICHFKHSIIVLSNNHEVDPKILKRNNYGIKIRGIHTFVFINNTLQNYLIQQLQLKIYFSERLVYREIRMQNQLINAGQQIELRQEFVYEQSESMTDRFSLKIDLEQQKNIRFDICNNELKLMKISGCESKIIQKLKQNGINSYQILYESKSEQMIYENIHKFCMHYKLLQYNIDSNEAEYRNQQISSKFGKIQLIQPGSPYIKLLLIIEVQINKENLHGLEGQLIDSITDLTRPQYVMISIFAKKTSNQLSYSHRNICQIYGIQLLDYFRSPN